MGAEPTKRCTRCGRTLPLTQYQKDGGTGFRGECKRCSSERKSRRYAEGKDLEARVRQCERKPTHNNAYIALHLAVNAGVVQRGTHCSGCGCPSSERKLEAHHCDYSRPLDVIWLCKSCHSRMDQQRREREAMLAARGEA